MKLFEMHVRYGIKEPDGYLDEVCRVEAKDESDAITKLGRRIKRRRNYRRRSSITIFKTIEMPNVATAQQNKKGA